MPKGRRSLLKAASLSEVPKASEACIERHRESKGDEPMAQTLHALHDESYGCNETRSKYTKVQKFDVARAILKEGTVKRAAEVTGIPYRIIREWRQQAWWTTIERKVTEELNGTLDNVLTANIHKSLEQLQDRLENGDIKVSPKGVRSRVPLPGKELAAVASLLYDKRAALRGEGFNLGEAVTVDFSKLKDQFQNFAKEVKSAKIVSEQ